MTILVRFKVLGKTVSILETEGSIEVEVSGAESPAQKTAIENYVETEGILEEVLSGNTNFWKTDISI